MSIKDKLCSKERIFWTVLTLGLAGAVVLETTVLSPSKLKFVGNHYTNRLVFNNSDSYRNITLKGEVEGVKDIEQLVLNSPFEESWVYYPTHKLWEETGIHSWNDDDTKAVISLYSPRTLAVNDDEGPFYFYHFHPSTINPAVMKQMQENLQKIDDRIKNGLREKFQIDPATMATLIPSVDNDSLEQKAYSLSWMRDALPSAQDLYTITINSAQAYLKNPKAELKWKICSKHGVMELSLTEEGKNFYSGRASSEIEEHSQKKWEEYRFAAPAGPFPSPGFDPIPVIKKVCASFSDELVQCNFIAYVEFYSQPTSTQSEHL